MHLADARLLQRARSLPAMLTACAAEDHRLVQIPDPLDIRPDPVHRDIQGTGDMALVIFIGGPKVDDHRPFPQCLSESPITPVSC